MKVSVNGKIGKVDGVNIGFFNEADTKIYTETDFDGHHIWMVKPVLRPLSDLTVEIEHNGERFVPKDSLHIEAFDYFDENVHSICLIEGFGFDLELLPFGLIQKLYEWHFDIHGLIKSGLAVNLNTIKS